MAITPRQFASLDELRNAVERLLGEVFCHCSDTPYAIMLSGGGTPLPIYEALAHCPPPVSEQLYIIYSDDRHVPISSPDSNYGKTIPMLSAMRQPPARIIYVRSELPLEDAAARYQTDLQDFFDRGGQLKLALLGTGSDGHTCSLFTDDDLAASKDRLAMHVVRPEPPHRVTVTPSVLEKAERVIFLVAGASKAAIIDQLLKSAESTIAGRAVARCANVELWYAI